jgi:ubiquitin
MSQPVLAKLSDNTTANAIKVNAPLKKANKTMNIFTLYSACRQSYFRVS